MQTEKEIQKELEAMQAAKIKEFEIAYQQLVEDYKLQLIPIIQIVPGHLPTAIMNVAKVK